MTEITQLNIGLKAGTPEAYKQLFNLYYTPSYLYALKLCNDSQKAEDIVQESMTKLWISRKNIDTEKPIKSYIFTIIKNTFIKSYNKSQKNQSLLDQLKTEVIDQIAIVEEENLKANQLKKINAQIEKLPEKSKVIFNLNKKRGLRYQEISELLNITEKTVESHIYRALQRIKSELQ